MRPAFISASPPLLIASTTSASLAFKTLDHVGKSSLSLAKATLEFLSVVFCDRIVRTKVSKTVVVEQCLFGVPWSSDKEWIAL